MVPTIELQDIEKKRFLLVQRMQVYAIFARNFF